MDIISYAKAGQVLKGAQKYDNDTVGIGAEDRFDTVDERIDYLENKLTGRYEERITTIDLSKGTFNNAELNDEGKLTLKVVKKTIVPDTKNLILNGATGVREQPYNLYTTSYSSSASSFGNWWNISDGNVSTGAETSIMSKFPIWVQINITNPVPLKRIKTYVDGYGKPKDWAILGSIDENTWDTLYSNTSETEPIIDLLIPDDKIKAYKYIRFQINSIRTGNRISIQEVEIYEALEGHIYVENGDWESDVIDLGPDWVEIKEIQFNEFVDNNTQNIIKSIAYSDDGVTFTEYELYDTASLQQHRFIKLKIELASTDLASTSKEYDYSHEENNDFSFDKDVVTQSNSITLNTSIIKDSTLKQEGIYETDISNIKQIFKMEMELE